jgi:hypothetical protein
MFRSVLTLWAVDPITFVYCPVYHWPVTEFDLEPRFFEGV